MKYLPSKFILPAVLVTTALVAAHLTHFHIPAHAESAEQCIYKNSEGLFKVVDARSKVPLQYRSAMRCRSAKKQERLAAPEDVTLSGTTRRETINTPLGKAELRWPRSVEKIFGRTPLRATVDSARTVAKMIRGSAFSSDMQKVDLPWKIVFMDETLSRNEIPSQLISNCHPGWMTPPANIYIVAQRVAAGCGGQQRPSASVADGQLAEVLVHEMAHAMEYQMLIKNPRHDRMRAEGFATWFEQSAAKYSSFLNGRKLRRKTALAADVAIHRSPEVFTFSGSGYDYARASMYFSAVESKFGVRGVTRVYERMVEDGSDLFTAIKSELRWDKAQLEREVAKVVSKYK